VIALDLTAAIRKVLNDFAGSSSLFNAAIESMGRTYPSAQVTAWHNTLFPSGSAAKIPIGIRYTPEMAAKAAIWIDDTDSPFGDKPLGNFVRWSGGSQMLGGLRTLTATVYVYHESIELCTVLASALSARMVLMTQDLQEGGYLSFEYMGGGALSTTDMAMNGWTQIGVRTLSYQATVQQQLADSVNPITDRNLSVLPEGAVSPTGIEGAVIAASVE
jgi:hypothetical protein